MIPDGQTTTRFTFRSVAAESMDRGNLLDDIVFDKAYRLNYDKNASDASGQVPSNERGRENTVQPAKAKTTGSVKTVGCGLTIWTVSTIESDTFLLSISTKNTSLFLFKLFYYSTGFVILKLISM